MENKFISVIFTAIFAACFITGCGNQENSVDIEKTLETLAGQDSTSHPVTSNNGTVQFSNETDEDAVYDFGYKASDYITIGDYKNIKVEDVDLKKITSTDVLEEIENRISIAGLGNESGNLTDEIVAELTNHKCNTVSEYKEYIQKYLEENAERDRKQAIFSEIMNKLSDSIEIKGTPEEEKGITFEELQSEAAEKGVNITELAQQYKDEGLFESDDTKELTINLLAQYTAEKENITVTEKDISDYRTFLLENGAAEENVSKLSKRKIAHLILNQKVFDYFAENNI